MSTAHNGDCEIYYETFGDGSNPALLMVNGLGSQCINYHEDWCAMFAANRMFVIRFDNRDVGCRRRSPMRILAPADNSTGVTLDDLDALIRTRRTSMLVDATRPVPHDLIEQLCRLAQWAPNHKRTWPWRFTVVEGDARGDLGNLIADAMAAVDDPPEKVAKTRGKYLRTPATLVVGAAPGDSPLRTAENRDAVAAGIQNLMLGATAAGLATYWGSCPKGANDAVAQWCGFQNGTHVTALIYIGWASTEVTAPERPEPDITYRH